MPTYQTKRILVLIFLVSLFFKLEGQGSGIRPLEKGKEIPEISVEVSTGATIEKKEKLSLKDIRAQLILLDYWGVDCLSCIASMPFLVKLAEVFKEDVAIFLVTENTPNEIRALWQKFENGTKSKKWVEAGKKMNFITGDSVINKLFPYIGKPTYVWLDKGRKYKLMTSSTEVTEKNIQDFINDSLTAVNEKSYTNLNYKEPLEWINKLGRDAIENYSLIFPSSPKMSNQFFSKIITDSLTQLPIGISCFNRTFTELVSLAFREWKPKIPFSKVNQQIPLSRFVFNVTDSAVFYPPNEMDSRTKWRYNNEFAYALKSRPTRLDKILDQMILDIENFFQVNLKIEERPVSAFVLKMDSTIKPPVCKAEFTNPADLFDKKTETLILCNMNLNSSLIGNYIRPFLAENFVDRPLINEISSEKTICLKIKWKEKMKSNALLDVKKSLAKYGIFLEEEVRNIEMLVVDEKKK
ncbi:MAG: TlpA family protein disulfide reductase [Agriterribacter sp.]